MTEPAKPIPTLAQRLEGTLLGTAVGDALGLPAEGLHPRKIHRRWNGRWKHRLVMGKGMISDDTEHTLFVAQALLRHPRDPQRFQTCLGWQLRLWLLGLPAGIGLATLRAILKLWGGVPPAKSGVFSAGNGPAMRSAVLGAFFHDRPDELRDFVRAATRLTHTDPKAEVAALAVAESVAWVVAGGLDREELLRRLTGLSTEEWWRTPMEKIQKGLQQELTTGEMAVAMGLENGISGYALHSVPMALFAWLRHWGDFEGALTSVLSCGGDTDTVGAITGALAGATTGTAGIKSEWIEGIVDYPRSAGLLRRVAQRLNEQRSNPVALGAVSYFWPALVVRNAFFLAMVLLHGFRRLLPPY